jgi:hypothetical protein
MKFVRQSVRDPAAGNVEAFVFLQPVGWQSEAAVEWTPAWSTLAFMRTRVVDPKSGLTIEFLPYQNFIWFQAPGGFQAARGGNYQGKMYWPPIKDPQEFVRKFWIPKTLPHLAKAKLVRKESVPKMAAEFKRRFGGPATASGHRLRYEFERDGKTWEEDVQFGLLFSGSAQLTTWYVNFATSVRAPKGEIDRLAGIASTVIASRTSTPEWDATFQIVQRLFNQGQQQQIADTAALGRMMTQYRNESAALQKQVTEERQASQDRMADYRRETLGGIETYRDQVNHALVEMPAGWKDYWVNEKGEYLLSDQAGFNPNMGSVRTWKKMERREK